MSKMQSILMLVAAFVLAVIAAASLVATIRAITVKDTLAAMDSTVGAGILTLIVAIMAIKSFKTGWRGLRSSEDAQA